MGIDTLESGLTVFAVETVLTTIKAVMYTKEAGSTTPDTESE